MPSQFGFKELLFPVAGLNRKNAIQSQPPYTTLDALNVRPYRPESKRMAGGSRPGTAPWMPNSVGGRVCMLAVGRGVAVKYREGSGHTVADGIPTNAITTMLYEFDDFKGGALSGKWTALDGNALPRVDDNPPNSKYESPVAAVHTALTVVDTDKTTVAEMSVSAVGGKPNHGKYTLVMGMDDDTPSISNGISAELTVADEGVSIVVKQGATEKYSGDLEGVSPSGVLSMRLTPNSVCEVSFGGVAVTSFAIADINGGRFGFKLEAEEEGCVTPIDYFQYGYYPDIEKWAAGGADDPGGELYLDMYAEIPVCNDDNGTVFLANGEWQSAENAVKIRNAKYVMAVQRLKDLFIADNLPTEHGNTDGTLTVSGGTATLTATSVSDWTALGIVAGSDEIVISNAATGLVVGTYIVSAVVSGGVTLAGYTGDTATGTCAWKLSVSPKVMNVDTKEVAPWVATVGSVPENCPLICLYRDRIVLAGEQGNPHLWYMSRQGDPYDWNYTEDFSSNEADAGIAVAGQNSDAGVIGLPIRALMPHSDDYLVFGYDNQLWILRGDPASGGQIDCISRSVGVAGKRAWCNGPAGEIIFLSTEGLYRLASGGSSLPQVISFDKTPVELVGLNYTHNVQMSYDMDAHGVHIFIEGRQQAWFYSLETDSLWPVELASGADVTALCEFERGVLMGCTDGFTRRHDEKLATDDGVPFDSYMLLGPMRLGYGDFSIGVLQQIRHTLCGSMNAIGNTIQFFVGKEPIDCVESYNLSKVSAVCKLIKGIDMFLSRVGGGALMLKVGVTAEIQKAKVQPASDSEEDIAEAARINAGRDGLGGRWWGIERIGAYIKKGGRLR